MDLNECNEHTACLMQSTVPMVLRYVLWEFCFRGELGLMNCNDMRMHVVNKQFELLEFVFDSVYVDWLCMLLCMLVMYAVMYADDLLDMSVVRGVRCVGGMCEMCMFWGW